MVARLDPVAVIKRCPLIGPVPVAALGLLVLDVSLDGQKLRVILRAGPAAECRSADRLRFDRRSLGVGILGRAEQCRRLLELLLSPIEFGAMGGQLFRRGQRVERLAGVSDSGLSAAPWIPFLVRVAPPAADAENDQ